MRFFFAAIAVLSVSACASHAEGVDRADAEASCTPDLQGEIKLTSILKTHKLPHFTPAVLNIMVQDKVNVSVIMDVHILKDGAVGDVSVSQSTGYGDMDRLAVNQVKEYWRWEPPIDLRTCKTTDAHTDVTMRFYTKD